MGDAVRERAPISVGDLSGNAAWPLRDVVPSKPGSASVLIVPLVRADRLFGTLVLMRREQAEFPETHH